MRLSPWGCLTGLESDDAVQHATAQQAGTQMARCPQDGTLAAPGTKFCPQCGHQLVVFDRCARCGKNLAPNAKFCPRCGLAAAVAPRKQFCPHCGAENLAESVFCNDCGDKL